MNEIKEVDGWFVLDNGRKFKLRKTAENIDRAECWLYASGRCDLYSWKKRYCMMLKGIGYLKLAAESEPYHPDIIWLDGLYSEMSEKSSDYMSELTKKLIAKLEKSAENGYKQSTNRTNHIFTGALKDYQRKIKEGKTWDKHW